MTRQSEYKMLFSLLPLIVCIALLAGCATVPHPPADIPDRKQTYQDKVIYYTHDYMISPGDKLEITYHVDLRQQDEYRISTGDQIRVEFFDYPQLDRTLNVRPDGRITVPYKGDIQAAGSTPMDLSARINQVYSDFLKHPRSTVSLIRYGENIRALKEAIKTATRGQSRLALVQPDGRISIPLLPPLYVVAQTIEQVQTRINEEYTKILPGMFTSVNLNAATGYRFYIFGAVKNAGFYELKGPTMVTQGIAMAGGFKDIAVPASTLLITRNEEKHAVARLIDVGEILSTGNLSTDLLLRQSDVIFVPTSTLGRAAVTGNAIRQMIPVNLGVFYRLDNND